jgi:hypothetical protein
MKPKVTTRNDGITEFVRKRGHEIQAPPGAFKSPEARKYLGGISVPTMHRLIRRGLLRPNRALRHLIFSREELDRFLRDGITVTK